MIYKGWLIRGDKFTEKLRVEASFRDNYSCECRVKLKMLLRNQAQQSANDWRETVSLHLTKVKIAAIGRGARQTEAGRPDVVNVG